MSALVTVAGKSFNGKSTATIDFDKYLDDMLVEFEQNRMARTTQNFELFGKK